MVDMHPTTLDGAARLLRDTGAPPVCGATDWMIGRDPGQRAVYLDRIAELREIRPTKGGLLLGAGCTFSALEGDERVPAALRDAVHDIASPAIRNRGTLGGNIANASPAGDTLPVLYALNATLELHSAYATRSMPIDAFITGPRKTVLRHGEFIARVFLPSFEGISRFEKVGARRAQAISKCSIAGFIHLADGGVRDLRIAFGAVGPTVMRSRAIEETLIGMIPEFALQRLPETLKAYERFLSPIDDSRSTAEYRRAVCINLLRGFLTNMLT